MYSLGEVAKMTGIGWDAILKILGSKYAYSRHEVAYLRWLRWNRKV